MDSMAARVAMNQARFREANERIERKAVVAGAEFVPFICECSDPDCTRLVRLTVGEYESVRAEPALFLNAPDHQAESSDHHELVSRTDRYVLVEKIGDARRIVEDLNPRARADDDAA